MTKVVLPSISLSVPCCTIFSVRVSIDEVASSMISRGVSAIAARAYAPGQYWLEEWVEGVSRPPMYLESADVYDKELPQYARENTTVSYLAATKDFRHYKKLGRLTEPTVDDRDVFIFPEKIGGNMFSSPAPNSKMRG